MVVKIKVAVLYNISDTKDTKEVENNLLDMAKSVSNALKANGYGVSLVNADDDMISNLRKINPEIVFNLAERFKGNPDFTPHVAALMEMNNIPFTGASSMCFATCDDKIIGKVLMQHHGISTPKFQVFESSEEKLETALKFPLIVKPTKTHNSIGISDDSVVWNEKEMRTKINYVLTSLKQSAIVEEYIDGREFNVAVLGNGKPYALPVCEADLSRSRSKVLSYNMKWHIDWYKEAPIICPVDLPIEIQEKLKKLAIEAHKKLGFRDYSRVDIRIGKGNNFYVLEVNTNPGLTKDCFIYHACKVEGIPYEELIGRILQHAAERYKIQMPIKLQNMG